MPDWVVLAGALFTLFANTIALLVGMARFRTWLSKAVIEPYVRPIRDDQRAMRSEQQLIRQEQTADRAMLRDHDRYIMMLLGKQLGSIPAFDIGEPFTKHEGV